MTTAKWAARAQAQREEGRDASRWIPWSGKCYNEKQAEGERLSPNSPGDKGDSSEKEVSLDQGLGSMWVGLAPRRRLDTQNARRVLEGSLAGMSRPVAEELSLGKDLRP